MSFELRLLSGDIIPHNFDDRIHGAEVRGHVASFLNIVGEQIQLIGPEGLHLQDMDSIHDMKGLSVLEAPIAIQVCVGCDPLEQAFADLADVMDFQSLVLTGGLALHVPANWPAQRLPDRIGEVSGLIKLKVGQIELSSLPGTFCELHALECLNLNGNGLQQLPSQFGSLTALQDLSIAANKLTSLPDSFCNLISLRQLVLEDNRLEELPDAIGELVSLQGLNLARNKLTVLPDSFGNLLALNDLCLDQNDVSILPASFCQLTSLTELDVGRNDLVSLPDDFGNLVGLRYLVLTNNSRLTELPSSCGNIRHLEEFIIDGRKILNWPASCEHLKELYFTMELSGGTGC